MVIGLTQVFQKKLCNKQGRYVYSKEEIDDGGFLHFSEQKEGKRQYPDFYS
jgi:hypothetical protein